MPDEFLFFVVWSAIVFTVGACFGSHQSYNLDNGVYIDEIEYNDGTYNYDTNVGIDFTSTTKYNIGDKVMIVK